MYNEQLFQTVQALPCLVGFLNTDIFCITHYYIKLLHNHKIFFIYVNIHAC